jgi:hypothetical protein
MFLMPSFPTNFVQSIKAKNFDTPGVSSGSSKKKRFQPSTGATRKRPKVSSSATFTLVLLHKKPPASGSVRLNPNQLIL